MVLVFIGAMWLIFAPSSGKEQPPGTDGYNTEMPDADKAEQADYRRQVESLRAWGDGRASGEPQPYHRAVERHVRPRDSGNGGRNELRPRQSGRQGGKGTACRTADYPILRCRYRDLNATLGNFYEQPKNDNAEMDELLERIASLESELESEKAGLHLWTNRWHLWRSPMSWRQSTWAVRTEESRNRRQSLPPCRRERRTRRHP